MAEIRLNKLIKHFNIGLDVLVDFLNSLGAGIENANPNMKVSDEYLPELHKKFGKDLELKETAEKKVDVKLTEILDKASRRSAESHKKEIRFMENSRHEVFISYSSRDTLIAQAICHRLEENGVICWMAPKSLIAGPEYPVQIVRAIRECAIMVLVFSSNSNLSHHVRNEVDQAFKANRIIIPFIVEETDINEFFDYYLSGKHWLVAYPDYREKTDELSETVRRLLQKEKKQETDHKLAVTQSKSVVTKNVGAEIHIETDVDCTVQRFGTVILEAKKGADNVIYLQKGKHRLSFSSKEDSKRNYRIDYEVIDTEICDVIEVCLEDYFLKGQRYYYEGKYIDAIEWFRKSVDEGNIDAQNYLGICYEYGFGVAQDYVEAVQWYRKSADQGNAFAQHNLGLCYESGRGVIQDYVEAVKWYRKSAEQGDDDSQFALGICYEKGLGVAQDSVEAIKWYKQSAAQGNADAKKKLER